MTTKVNARPSNGTWHERDVEYVDVTVANTTAGTTFSKREGIGADGVTGDGNFRFGVDGWTEKVIRALETRGTVIAFELKDPSAVPGGSGDGVAARIQSDSLSVVFGSSAGSLRNIDGTPDLSATTGVRFELEEILEEILIDRITANSAVISVHQLSTEAVVANPTSATP